MHADLMLLYLCYLWIMITMKKKSWAKLLLVNLLSYIAIMWRGKILANLVN